MREALYPSLYQINTHVWMTELACQLGRPVKPDDIPDTELDRIAGSELSVAVDRQICSWPSGVGEAFDPPRYLQPGDVVRCEVEGLGALEHSISEIR